MNKTENTTIQLSELIYLAYFTVMFGARAIGLYEGMLPYNIMLVTGMLLFLLKIAMTRHTYGEYLLIGVLLFISLIVYYNTGEKGLLLYFYHDAWYEECIVKKSYEMGCGNFVCIFHGSGFSIGIWFKAGYHLSS